MAAYKNYVQEMMASDSKIVLLDVDKTLVHTDSNTTEYFDDKLIEHLILLAQDPKMSFYLFTNMSASDAKKSAGVKEGLSRGEVVRYLEKRGVKISAVITPADAGYDKGLGAAYRDYIKPYDDGTKKYDEKSFQHFQQEFDELMALSNGYRFLLHNKKGNFEETPFFTKMQIHLHKEDSILHYRIQKKDGGEIIGEIEYSDGEKIDLMDTNHFPQHEAAILRMIMDKHGDEINAESFNSLPLDIREQCERNDHTTVDRTKATMFHYLLKTLAANGKLPAQFLYFDDADACINAVNLLANFHKITDRVDGTWLQSGASDEILLQKIKLGCYRMLSGNKEQIGSSKHDVRKEENRQRLWLENGAYFYRSKEGDDALFKAIHTDNKRPVCSFWQRPNGLLQSRPRKFKPLYIPLLIGLAERGHGPALFKLAEIALNGELSMPKDHASAYHLGCLARKQLVGEVSKKQVEKFIDDHKLEDYKEQEPNCDAYFIGGISSKTMLDTQESYNLAPSSAP